MAGLALDRFGLLQPHLENEHALKAVAAAVWYPVPNCSELGVAVSAVRVRSPGAKKRTDTGQDREVSAKLKEIIEG